MGLADVTFFFVLAGTNLQWTATAAAAGPSSVAVWIIGFFAMFVPLAYVVVGLSSRYPHEGGLYVWSKLAFGDFAGFLTGWTYWSSNLPYFPGILYFGAANALVAGGDRWKGLSQSPVFYMLAAAAGLALATSINVLGLGTGKWLFNIGSVARWLATLILIGVGGAVWWRFGSANSWTAKSMTPGFQFRDLIFWSTIAFAWTGVEAASFMGEEIRDTQRTIPRAIFASAPFIALIYIGGTIAILVLLRADSVSGLDAVLQAIRSGAERLGASWLTPVAAVLVAATVLGSVGAWLGSVARIPFVAGIDHFLPEGFGRLHPRFGSPHVALWTQAAVTLPFIVLSQAGTTVRGAYEVLVSMMVVATFLPFLFTFAAGFKLLRGPEPPGVVHLPGGRRAAVALSGLGLLTTILSILLALFPSEQEPHKTLAVVKVLGATLLMVGIGVAFYRSGRRRALAAAAHGDSGAAG